MCMCLSMQTPKSPPAEVSKEPFVVDGLLHPDLIVVVWTVAAFQG